MRWLVCSTKRKLITLSFLQSFTCDMKFVYVSHNKLYFRQPQHTHIIDYHFTIIVILRDCRVIYFPFSVHICLRQCKTLIHWIIKIALRLDEPAIGVMRWHSWKTNAHHGMMNGFTLYEPRSPNILGA